MTIGQLGDLYNDFWGQIIRVYEGEELKVCGYPHELAKQMTLDEYLNLFSTEFKKFDANGVAIHFYI